jgi:hypothetical protein
LEAAVDSCQDARVLNKDELPLAETYLNIANAHSFLGKLEEALVFASKAENYSSITCDRLL